MHSAIAILKPRTVFGIIAPNAQFQPFGQRVHHRHTHAVQTARHFVSIAALIGIVEFSARMQLRHDHFGGGYAFFSVNIHRDATAIVAHGNRVISVDFHRYRRGMASQRFVNAVIDNLIHHVVQTRPIIGIADIHAGAFANRL